MKAGKLPPVEERIGQDPLVIKPVHEIGKYGGTWRRGFTGPGDTSTGLRSVRQRQAAATSTSPAPSRRRTSRKSWEFSADGKTLTTLTLRRGMKWSDGKPFTADDFVFWFEDLYKNKDLVPSPSPSLTINGKPAKMEKVDKYDRQVGRSGSRTACSPTVLTGIPGLGRQAHDSARERAGRLCAGPLPEAVPPQVRAKDELDKKAKDAKFDNWVNLLKFQDRLGTEPGAAGDRPRGRRRSPINTATWVAGAQPVLLLGGHRGQPASVHRQGPADPGREPGGHQPARHRRRVRLSRPATSTSASCRSSSRTSRRAATRSTWIRGGSGSDAALLCNQSYEADAEIAKWLTNRDFRRALSLGIDRDQINETFWLGLGTPGSVGARRGHALQPRPGVPQALLHLDVEERQRHARQDRAEQEGRGGLPPAHRGKGQRLRIELTTYLGFMPFTQIAEMIKEQWEKIGIQADVVELERSLPNKRVQSNEHQIIMETMWGTDNIFGHTPLFFPYDPTARLGPLYGTWFASGGARARSRQARMKELMDIYRKAAGRAGRRADQARQAGRRDLGRRGLDHQRGGELAGLAGRAGGQEQRWATSPSAMWNSAVSDNPMIAHPETYFFKS